MSSFKATFNVFMDGVTIHPTPENPTIEAVALARVRKLQALENVRAKCLRCPFTVGDDTYQVAFWPTQTSV